MVPKDISTGTFSTPKSAVERATSPLLGMVRFIKYPKEIVHNALELEILYPKGSKSKFQRIARNQYAKTPKTVAANTQK